MGMIIMIGNLGLMAYMLLREEIEYD